MFCSILQSPGGMLKREKTVVDVNLSDSMKEEVFQQLIAQQTTLNKKISSEQKKREEQVSSCCHDNRNVVCHYRYCDSYFHFAIMQK